MVDWVGLAIIIVIMTGVIINLSLVVFFMLRELKMKLLHSHKNRAMKKLEKKIQKMDPTTDYRVKRRRLRSNYAQNLVLKVCKKKDIDSELDEYSQGLRYLEEEEKVVLELSNSQLELEQ